MKLPSEFYTRSDVVQIAKELLGKELCTYVNGTLCVGRITETEAYCGANDKACHAFGGRRSQRTEVMYDTGGHAYVYLCYGIHRLFNVVTNTRGAADAVLIRALEPLSGIEQMLHRRNKQASTPELTSGPGRLTKAMGIDLIHNALNLGSDIIWIQDSSDSSRVKIESSTRIGVEYSGESALLPWRFTVKSSKWLSKPARN